MGTQRKGFTLVELLIVIVIIGILAGLLIPAVVVVLHKVKVAKCGANLRSLMQSAAVYRSMHGGRDMRLPREQGGAFWLKLSQTNPPLVHPVKMAALYSCPVSTTDPAPGACEYRGPAADANGFEGGDPVGADLSGAHGPGRGGNVVFLEGHVHECEESSLEWQEAGTKTRP